MISKIRMASIVVADQDAALAFFVDTLGWEKAMDNMMGPEMRWVTVVPRGSAVDLILAHVSWAGDGKTPGGNSGVVLAAPDIDATYETLLSRGVKFKEPVTLMPWGQKATWFYDVDGNEFFLVEE